VANRRDLRPTDLRAGQRVDEPLEAYRVRIAKAQRDWSEKNPGRKAKQMRDLRAKLHAEGRCTLCGCPTKGLCEGVIAKLERKEPSTR
jgi:hypothetical protein